MPDTQLEAASNQKILSILFLLVITVLGAFLRLNTIGHEDLWIDEVLTITYTHSSFFDLWFRPSDPTPPLYYTLFKLLVSDTGSPVAVRSLSAVLGILSIPVIYAVGRSLGNDATGLAAALFLAVSGPHITYSQEARAYALLFLLVLLSSYYLSEALKKHSDSDTINSRAYVAFLIFSIMAVYTHYTAVFWLALAHVILLLDAVSSANRIRQIRIWSTGAVWTSIALIPAFWMAFGVVDRFHLLSPIAAKDFFSILRELLFVREPWQGHIAAEVALCLFLLAGLILAFRSKRTTLVLIIFLLFPLALWAAQVVKPVFMFRTALPFLIAPLLLWAFVVSALQNWLRVTMAAMIAMSLLTSHLVYERSGKGRYDWSGAAQFLEANAARGDVIILCQFFTHPALRFYLDDRSSLPFVGVVNADVGLLFPDPGSDRDAWHSFEWNDLPRVSPSAVQASYDRGSRGWIIKSHCGGRRTELLDGFLRKVATEPREVWRGNNVAIEMLRF